MMSRYDRAVRCALALAAILATGCGRLEFERATDASSAGGDTAVCVPVGHDEDGDGVDDACDLCPQRVPDGAPVDGDGDGIGDECDVSPLAQTREAFDPFTGARSDVWAMMNATYVGDAVRFDNLTSGNGAYMAGTPGRETFEITGNLVQSDPAQSLVSVSINNSANGAYYCELFDGGADVRLNFTYTPDQVAYTQIDTALLPGRFDSGPFRLILDHTPPTTTCYAEWGGERVSVGGTNPGDIIPATSGIGTFQVLLDVTSFVRLSTP